VKADAGTLHARFRQQLFRGHHRCSGDAESSPGWRLGAGDVQVASGATLILSNAVAIGSTANLLLADSTATVNLAFAGTSFINQLSFDGGVSFQPSAPGFAHLRRPIHEQPFCRHRHPQRPGRLRASDPGAGSNLLLTWPTNWTSLALFSASILTTNTAWQLMTNPVVVQSNLNVVTLINPTNLNYFQLRGTVDPTTIFHKLMFDTRAGIPPR